MFFRQHYLGCLSHASYLIGDETTGRAVVVDHQRDVEGYLDDAAAHELAIEQVIETHLHATSSPATSSSPTVPAPRSGMATGPSAPWLGLYTLDKAPEAIRLAATTRPTAPVP